MNCVFDMKVGSKEVADRKFLQIPTYSKLFCLLKVIETPNGSNKSADTKSVAYCPLIQFNYYIQKLKLAKRLLAYASSFVLQLT